MSLSQSQFFRNIFHDTLLHHPSTPVNQTFNIYTLDSFISKVKKIVEQNIYLTILFQSLDNKCTLMSEMIYVPIKC